MFAYYIDLALRSLKHNKVLTALMVLAIAVGIGASMTTLTVLHVLSGSAARQERRVVLPADRSAGCARHDARHAAAGAGHAGRWYEPAACETRGPAGVDVW